MSPCEGEDCGFESHLTDKVGVDQLVERRDVARAAVVRINPPTHMVIVAQSEER